MRKITISFFFRLDSLNLLKSKSKLLGLNHNIFTLESMKKVKMRIPPYCRELKKEEILLM